MVSERKTARLRHDFRHSVRLLSDMAGRGDLEGVRAYLAQYETTLTEKYNGVLQVSNSGSEFFTDGVISI